MREKCFYNLLLLFIVPFLMIISSCQKDNDIKDPVTLQSHLTDSLNVADALLSPGNFLASAGMVKIFAGDSIYTFDASRDSIAFVNVHTDDKTTYFGITAINKEHTMSFGISAPGFAVSNISRGIAGSQLLLSPANNMPYSQYSLSRFFNNKEPGSINLIQYHQRTELAKGTFQTYLAKDDKADSPYYKVTGTFDLQFK